MIPQTCLLIEASKFPIAPGESDEVVNDGMYGKALCLYLQARLPEVGLEAPAYLNEDWGWWLEVQFGQFEMALCIYSDSSASGNPERYAILPSIAVAKRWSWRKLAFVDASEDVCEVMSRVEKVLLNDPEVRRVTRHDDFPL